MTDAQAGRENSQIVIGIFTPFEKVISLKVLFKFPGFIYFLRFLAAESLHLNGVINDQIYWNSRIYHLRVDTFLLRG